MDIVLQTKKDPFIRISNKYRIGITEIEAPIARRTLQLATPSTPRRSSKTPTPVAGLDGVLDAAMARVRYTSKNRSETPEGIRLASVPSERGNRRDSTMPPPATPLPKGERRSVSNTMMTEIHSRPNASYAIQQQLSSILMCKDAKCRNRRDNVQFTFCFIDPDSKKHLLVTPGDIEKCRRSIGDDLATVQNPPSVLYRGWLREQDLEASKLASGPGGSGSSRYSTGRGLGGGNTQNVNNVNISLDGNLADLARLQNAPAQLTANTDNEYQLPSLQQPSTPRNPAYSRSPFVLPDRSSSPPHIADPVSELEIRDFLDRFNQEHFSRKPALAAAMTKVSEAAQAAAWNFNDLRAQRIDFFIRKGLPKVWIPVLYAEAKEHVKEIAARRIELNSGDDFNPSGNNHLGDDLGDRIINPQEISLQSIEHGKYSFVFHPDSSIANY